MSITYPSHVPDLPDPEYRAVDGLSQSILKHFAVSARRGKAAMDRQLKIASEEALLVGRLVHTATLEPHLLDAEYVVAPSVDRRTKQGKAEYAAFLEGVGTRTVVSPSQMDLAQAIRDAVRAHPLASEILAAAGAAAEVSQFWTTLGEPCKGRLDWLVPDWGGDPLIFDLKTTVDASPNGFARACANFKYHMQAYAYSEGYAQVTGVRPRFFFGAVEKEPPYDVALYELEEDAIDRGREIYLAAIETYQQAVQSGNWPGYSDRVVRLSLPPWA